MCSPLRAPQGVFCTFRCDILFGLWSFLFSFVPLPGVFPLFIYLLILGGLLLTRASPYPELVQEFMASHILDNLVSMVGASSDSLNLTIAYFLNQVGGPHSVPQNHLGDTLYFHVGASPTCQQLVVYTLIKQISVRSHGGSVMPSPGGKGEYCIICPLPTQRNLHKEEGERKNRQKDTHTHTQNWEKYFQVLRSDSCWPTFPAGFTSITVLDYETVSSGDLSEMNV